jgi:hypothetical protein
VRAVITLVLAMTLTACANDVTGPTQGELTLAGTVQDFKTRAPLPGAVVQFRTDIQTPFVSVTADAAGRYNARLPHRGLYLVSVDGGAFGQTQAEGTYRGDLLVDTGTCVARYGAVTDEDTGHPIGGAKVTMGTVATITASDGWYVADMGCPESGLIGFNTTLATIERSGYTPQMPVLGRGIGRVLRLDVVLKKTG